jgi:hypothetical protein
MKSEQEYRNTIEQVFVGTGPGWNDGGAEWNNQMLLALAIHGLALLPFPHEHAQPPFKHYIEMQHPAIEWSLDENGIARTSDAAWIRSWVVDADWEEHYKPPLKFSFTPLTRKE